MIEMLGVLAIIGVLSAGGIMGYSVAMEKHKVNQSIEDIQTMIASARNLFIGKTSTTSVYISSKQLQSLGVISNKYKIDDADACSTPLLTSCLMTSLFGGKMAVWFQDGWAPSENAKTYNFLVVQFQKLPLSACVKILTHPWNNEASYFRYGIRKEGAWSEARDTLPSLEVAKTECEGIDTLSFSFFLDYKGDN